MANRTVMTITVESEESFDEKAFFDKHFHYFNYVIGEWFEGRGISKGVRTHFEQTNGLRYKDPAGEWCNG